MQPRKARMVRFEDIKFNCRLYNGYKPCIHGNECAGCPYYDPLELPTNFTPVPSPQPVVYPADANSILIIKTGAMGDVLRTTTLLHGIKRRFPKARVTWVTAPECVPLLKANPFIHELLPFSQETCAQLEHQSFDVLLNFEKEKEPLLLAGRIHAHARAGFCLLYTSDAATIYSV